MPPDSFDCSLKAYTMKVLIIYGTTEGQTRKIARFMEDVLQDMGHKVAIADATDEPPDPSHYDAVMIGSSIHLHKYNPAVTHYVTQHARMLNQMPSAFFSVCLAVASDLPAEHREAQKIMEDFLEKAEWEPLEMAQIAGALKYTQYDFLKRMLMRM